MVQASPEGRKKPKPLGQRRLPAHKARLVPRLPVEAASVGGSAPCMWNLAPTALALTLVACSAPRRIRFEPRLGPLSVDGDVGVGSFSEDPGNSVDEAGIEDDSLALELAGQFQWGDGRLDVLLHASSHDGSGTLAQEMNQGSATIAAGTDVTTDFGWNLLELGWTFDLGSERFGFGAGLALIDVEYETSDLAGTATIDASDTIPFPYFSYRASGALGRVEVELLANGLAIAVLGQSTSYFDLDLRGRLPLHGAPERTQGLLTFGWRYQALELEYDVSDSDVAVDLSFNGPYLGFQLGL